MPSSLPDPPGYVPPPKLPLRQRFADFTVAVRQYIDSWDRAKVDAELRRQRGETEADVAERQREREELRLLAQEVGEAAQGGAKAMVPYLQHLYKTRAAAYRAAVKEFISGYNEGFQEAHEADKNDSMEADTASQQSRSVSPDSSNRSTAAPKPPSKPP